MVERNKNMFKFKWENGSLNDNGTKILRENGISFHYEKQKLKADIFGIDWYLPVEYKPLGNDWYEIEFVS